MAMSRPSWAPVEVDPSKPSVARVYDFYLGGSHNFESDREFGRQALSHFPGLRQVLLDNRTFLRRVVLFLVAHGVDQFLDLGSGIPTVGNVHEVAQAVNPRARVLYVDHDPVAVAHSRALLAGNDRATAVAGDIREPAQVLRDAVHAGLDLHRPVAVLFIAVLHFVDDSDRPAELIAQYMAATAPGSYLAISHAMAVDRPAVNNAAKVYEQSRSPGAMRFRSRAGIESLFGTVTLVDPGVVLVPRWHPELTDDVEAPRVEEAGYPGLVGLGRRS